MRPRSRPGTPRARQNGASGNPPEPTPSSSRPSDRCWSVATCVASQGAGRRGTTRTLNQIFTRSVTAAAVAKVSAASRAGVCVAEDQIGYPHRLEPEFLDLACGLTDRRDAARVQGHRQSCSYLDRSHTTTVQLQLVSRSSTHAALSHRCNAPAPAPCVDYDADNDLWLVRGRSFKNAVDADGNKLPAGELRRDLWVVVGIVAQAIGLLERAAPAPAAVPARISPYRQRQTAARRPECAGCSRDAVAHPGSVLSDPAVPDYDRLSWIGPVVSSMGNSQRTRMIRLTPTTMSSKDRKVRGHSVRTNLVRLELVLKAR
jgi:hypothetical protein